VIDSSLDYILATDRLNFQYEEIHTRCISVHLIGCSPWICQKYYHRQYNASSLAPQARRIIWRSWRWPGLDPHQDYTLKAKRVVFGSGRAGFDAMGPLRNMSSPGQACNPSPVAPDLIAPARAGSNMTFQYTEVCRCFHMPTVFFSLIRVLVDHKSQGPDANGKIAEPKRTTHTYHV
jgi:hypothetical protein